ncbi:hypothetical protein J6590_020579 [Homalodisca vitripennis]|nr:hypothetical protein J6590_020579 [Homalodisca vitripennis]
MHSQRATTLSADPWNSDEVTIKETQLRTVSFESLTEDWLGSYSCHSNSRDTPPQKHSGATVSPARRIVVPRVPLSGLHAVVTTDPNPFNPPLRSPISYSHIIPLPAWSENTHPLMQAALFA